MPSFHQMHSDLYLELWIIDVIKGIGYKIIGQVTDNFFCICRPVYMTLSKGSQPFVHSRPTFNIQHIWWLASQIFLPNQSRRSFLGLTFSKSVFPQLDCYN